MTTERSHSRHAVVSHREMFRRVKQLSLSPEKYVRSTTRLQDPGLTSNSNSGLRIRPYSSYVHVVGIGNIDAAKNRAES